MTSSGGGECGFPAVGEHHETYGNCYGHGERIFCSRSHPEQGEMIVHELLVTHR